MKKRYVQDRIRSDVWFTELDPIEKLLWIYLLTNDKLGVCGIYELSLKRMWYDTWIDKDMILKILARFEKDKKCFYRNGFILICNFFKNLQVSSKNDNLRKGVEREIQELWNHIEHFYEADIADTMKTLIRPLQDPYKELGILYLTLLNLTQLNFTKPDGNFSEEWDLEKPDEEEWEGKKKKSIVNKNNRQPAIEIYDYLKSFTGVIDWDLNDCIYLLYQLEKVTSVEWTPLEKLKQIVENMIATWQSKFYSISSPSKLNDNLWTIISKLMSEKITPHSKKTTIARI